MSTAYFGGKGGTDKYRKMIGKELVGGKYHRVTGKDGKEYLAEPRAKAKSQALKKRMSGDDAKRLQGRSPVKEDRAHKRKFGIA